MKTLPEHKPRRPIGSSQTYAQSVEAYGKPPEGYRWLKIGEVVERESDIMASWGGWMDYPAHSIVNEMAYPIARPVKGIKIVAPLEGLLSRTVLLDHNRGATRLKPALKALTNSEILDGCYSAQTVLDLRDALREAIRLLEKH